MQKFCTRWTRDSRQIQCLLIIILAWVGSRSMIEYPLICFFSTENEKSSGWMSGRKSDSISSFDGVSMLGSFFSRKEIWWTIARNITSADELVPVKHLRIYSYRPIDGISFDLRFLSRSNFPSFRKSNFFFGFFFLLHGDLEKMKLKENWIETVGDKENTSKVDFDADLLFHVSQSITEVEQIKFNRIIFSIKKLFCLIFQQRNSICCSFSIVNW